jgi:hypothetical protein
MQDVSKNFYFWVVGWWWWWSCRLGETTSLNYGHQQAYCSSPSWYMNMENRGGMTSRKNLYLSTRALWQSYQQRHLVAKQEQLGEGNYDWPYKISLFILEGIFNMPYNCTAWGWQLSFEGRCAADFYHPWVHRLQPGLNPWTLGPVASMLAITPPSWNCLFLKTV